MGREEVAVKLSLISIGSRQGRGKQREFEVLVERYLQRTANYAAISGAWVETETTFWGAVEDTGGRSTARVICMDSGGRPLSSREFAAALGSFRDRGAQHIVLGIGGADGWGKESKARADLLVSMGAMTLPHGLARLVAAEQVYRAMTILAGHPYHCGH